MQPTIDTSKETVTDSNQSSSVRIGKKCHTMTKAEKLVEIITNLAYCIFSMVLPSCVCLIARLPVVKIAIPATHALAASPIFGTVFSVALAITCLKSVKEAIDYGISSMQYLSLWNTKVEKHVTNCGCPNSA